VGKVIRRRATFNLPYALRGTKSIQDGHSEKSQRPEYKWNSGNNSLDVHENAIKNPVVLYKVYRLLAIDNRNDVMTIGIETLLQHPSVQYVILQ
jgi:hypothetical protein